MTELGKIEKPPVEDFRKGKKLYFVPLLFSSDKAPEEYKKKVSVYWQQVSEQLSKLEGQIGSIRRIYHESIVQPGEDGLKMLENLSPGSYQVVKNKCESGAVLEAFEDKELLEETIDWERCIFSGLTSQKVAMQVSESYFETSKKRAEFLSKQITETLKEEEVGLLFIQEEHKLQFAGDIEVFSIFPPALDEIHRWLREPQKKNDKSSVADKEASKADDKSPEKDEESPQKGEEEKSN